MGSNPILDSDIFVYFLLTFNIIKDLSHIFCVFLGVYRHTSLREIVAISGSDNNYSFKLFLNVGYQKRLRETFQQHNTKGFCQESIIADFLLFITIPFENVKFMYHNHKWKKEVC